MDIPLDKSDKIFVEIDHCLDGIVEAVQIPLMKTLEGSIKKRIHNKGKDTEEQFIFNKKYSRQHAKKRAALGRRTDLVDLQLEGDLFKSFQTIIKGNEAQLGFVDEQQALIAEVHEQRNDEEIWTPTDNDLKVKAPKAIKKAVEGHFRRCFGVI